MTLAEVEHFISAVGFPVALCVAACFAAWRAGVWFANHVATPLTDKALEIGSAHIHFLNENTRATQVSAVTIGQVLSNQENYGPKIHELHEKLVTKVTGTSQQQDSVSDSSHVTP